MEEANPEVMAADIAELENSIFHLERSNQELKDADPNDPVCP